MPSCNVFHKQNVIYVGVEVADSFCYGPPAFHPGAGHKYPQTHITKHTHIHHKAAECNTKCVRYTKWMNNVNIERRHDAFASIYLYDPYVYGRVWFFFFFGSRRQLLQLQAGVRA